MPLAFAIALIVDPPASIADVAGWIGLSVALTSAVLILLWSGRLMPVSTVDKLLASKDEVNEVNKEAAKIALAALDRSTAQIENLLTVNEVNQRLLESIAATLRGGGQ